MPKGIKTRNNGASLTEVEKELRLQKCAEYLYENPNCRYTDFVQHFMKEFDVLRNMATIYWKQGQEKLGSMVHEELSADRKRAVVRLLKILKVAESTDDHKLYLEVSKEINKIQGLHSTKVDVTSGGEKIERTPLSELVSFTKKEDDDET